MKPRWCADEVCSGSETSTEEEFVELVSGHSAPIDSSTDDDSVFEADGTSDLEDDYLVERVAFHKAQGRARSRRTPWSQELVEREFDFWKKYVFHFRLPVISWPLLDLLLTLLYAADSVANSNQPLASLSGVSKPAKRKSSRPTSNGA